jgi:hypothetical protein
MGTVVFVCPATGYEVSTGVEVEPGTFKSLHLETVRCPHCRQLHQLAGMRAWLTQREDRELPQEEAA